ncbi:hypothetical protein D2E25_1571 [Bifidobacterium goeldii]|uniref:Uncharacterized protein n=1 Tax=Bifidobacterium goeldii TaxID=2306975 RepID=A0A430FH77_9BIFI|nr:hypothetical protein D2E25_1571 [Bifidobacterium goeldii]
MVHVSVDAVASAPSVRTTPCRKQPGGLFLGVVLADRRASNNAREASPQLQDAVSRRLTEGASTTINVANKKIASREMCDAIVVFARSHAG